jgi:transcriptional regulator with XRE-family HTH domain
MINKIIVDFLFKVTHQLLIHTKLMNKKTYENIRKIREMNDLTRDYVAAELKMSTSGYGKIERGVDLTLSKLCKISAIFSISIKIYCILMFQIFLRTIQRG